MRNNRTVFAGEASFSVLVSRARAGDQDAFAALYEATSKDVYCAVRAMVRTEEMAMDIQQDTYVFAFTHLDQLGDPDKFRAWVHSIAVNRTRSLLRKQTPVLFSELEAEEDPVPEIADFSTESSPELSLDRKETVRLVREILEELSDGQRLLIGLYYYDQMPVGKIAEALEVTPGTVKKQLSRARKKIEAAVKRLEENGTKLYGLSPLPVLLALLRGQTPAARAERAVLTGTLSKAGVTAKAVAIHLGRPFFETALGRVVVGVLAAVVVGGGVVGYNWFQARATYGPDRVPETVETAENLTTEPTADPTTEPIPTRPETAEDIITEPETSEPVTTETDTEPGTTEPKPTVPAPTEPKPTDPKPTEPDPTEPNPTEPKPTDPVVTEPTQTEPTAESTELVSWNTEYGTAGTSVLTLQTKTLNSTVFITVNVRGAGQPKLTSSNPTVTAVSAYREEIALDDGITAYRWALNIGDFGEADVICELNGVSRVIAQTKMPKPEPLFVRADWQGRGDPAEISNAVLNQTETLSVIVQGMEAPDIELDTPGILSVSGPTLYNDENWKRHYTWKLTPTAAGTVHVRVKFGGSTVKTYSITVAAKPPMVDSGEDLDCDP